MTKLEALSKPNWSIEEIQAYLQCCRVKAVDIKNEVKAIYGEINATKGKSQSEVSADNVIKYLGGNSRAEELQILILIKNDLKKEIII